VPLTQGPQGPPVVIDSSQKCGNILYHIRRTYLTDTKTVHIEGTVILDVTITKTGEVGGIHVVFGNPTLVRAAIGAVKQWQYSVCPNGKKMTMEVSFSLNQ